jgi:hypothetical protein
MPVLLLFLMADVDGDVVFLGPLDNTIRPGLYPLLDVRHLAHPSHQVRQLGVLA